MLSTTPAARCCAASRSSSSPAASRSCSRASTPTRSPTGVDSYSFRAAARRLRRDHAVQLPGDGADVDAPGGHRLRQHVRAQAERARPGRVRPGRPSCGAEAGLPDGVFNVVHGDKVAVDALLDHPDVAAVSFVGSTPIAKYIHERAPPRTASGCRRSAAPRTTRSSCPTPTSTSPPTTWSRPATARPASAAWRSPPPSPSGGVGRRAGRAGRREKARDDQGRLRPRRRQSRWARSSRPRPATGSSGCIGDGRAAGRRRSSVDGRGLTRRRPRGRLLRRPDPDRPRHAPRWTSTPRRSSARCSSVRPRADARRRRST